MLYIVQKQETDMSKYAISVETSKEILRNLQCHTFKVQFLASNLTLITSTTLRSIVRS